MGSRSAAFAFFVVSIAIGCAQSLACGGPPVDRPVDAPKAVVSVAPAQSTDAGIEPLAPIDAHVYCEVYGRVGEKLGAKLDARIAAGPITEADARALMELLGPEAAIPVVREVIAEMHRQPEEVMRWGADHPEIARRCVSGMVSHLQPRLMLVARATSGIAWRVDPSARAGAVAKKEPVLYVACATWVMACRELDRKTFADPRVKTFFTSGGVVPIYDDMSNDQDPGVVARAKELRVNGLPTLILFDREGREQKRLTEFVEPDALSKELSLTTR